MTSFIYPIAQSSCLHSAHLPQDDLMQPPILKTSKPKDGYFAKSGMNVRPLEFTLCSLILTLILLTWRIGWAPNNASKWQMGFNSAFKGLMSGYSQTLLSAHVFRHHSMIGLCTNHTLQETLVGQYNWSHLWAAYGTNMPMTQWLMPKFGTKTLRPKWQLVERQISISTFCAILYRPTGHTYLCSWLKGTFRC